MPAVSKSQLANFAVLPLVMVVFFALRIVAQTHPEIDAWIPRWDRLMLFAVVIILAVLGVLFVRVLDWLQAMWMPWRQM